jgi:hypothetical protein
MRKHCRQLDASVEASGPHDFTVRISAFRPPRTIRVHRIPPSTFVTIASAPLLGMRPGLYKIDFSCFGRRIFFEMGLDNRARQNR